MNQDSAAAGHAATKICMGTVGKVVAWCSLMNKIVALAELAGIEPWIQNTATRRQIVRFAITTTLPMMRISGTPELDYQSRA